MSQGLERLEAPPGAPRPAKAPRALYTPRVTERSLRPPERRIAVYPGSFDPITLGHLDILERAAGLFDRVVVAVGQHPTKRGYFSAELRRTLAEKTTAHVPNVSVQGFSGLVVDFCREQGASVIIRGLRATGDFESEFQMALANRELAPRIETVFLVPRADRMFVSSSLVREIASHGGNFERYVTKDVAVAVRERVARGAPDEPGGTA
jgi:pantetheine-phosphate adenylyltransferase